MPDRIPAFARLENSLSLRQVDRHNNRRLRKLAEEVTAHAPPAADVMPVAFFRASTGLLRLSQNAAFSLLPAWVLRLRGVPVVFFTCQAGMSRCVQGLNREDYYQAPPCKACTAQASRTYEGTPVHGFPYQADLALEAILAGKDLETLSKTEYGGLPLGKLALPSLRWTLRRHHLPDDEPTRFLMREYLLSGRRVAAEFNAFLDRANPQAVVVFNGTFFPEAIARRLALARGLRVISHEVGMRALSAFFTPEEATAYPVHLPRDFELNQRQNSRLDAYLAQRFKGDFTMAGIRFWPEMRRLDDGFLAQAARFRQVVPVFTNVVYDTSQLHANTVFPHMFAWLDTVLELIHAHPDTLFVLRAHPDELRPNKVSRETVGAWASRNGIHELPNAIFIDGDEYLSSYELIQRSKFVIVYNSSIGLEAALLGAAVVCGGASRYTPYPITLLPDTPAEFKAQCEAFLAAEQAAAPDGGRELARRFLYYQLFRLSLPFDDYLEAHPRRPGFVKLREFTWEALTTDRSPTLRTIVDGILKGAPFTLPDEAAEQA
jgi:hypothetical protein